MSDRREEIIFDKLEGHSDGWETRYSFSEVKVAMDEYMKEGCIALLEYVAFNTTDTLVDVSGVKFKYKGEWITKEQLFENFL